MISISLHNRVSGFIKNLYTQGATRRDLNSINNKFIKAKFESSNKLADI